MFRWISGLFCRDVGIDLGTANVVTYVKGQGIVGNEPSVVALKRTGQKGREKIIAVGTAAKAMIGKTPHGVETVRPLQHGVIADYEMTEAMISHFLRMANGGRSQFAHPRVVICVPACVTEVERRAVIDATLGAGAREAYVVEEPVAAAIGAGLPIAEPRGNMVVDIGGGTSEVAVLSLGGIVVHEALRSAGDEMDQAIIAMLRQNYTLHVGEVTAEEIKICIGSAVPYDGEEEEMEVKGRDLMDGLPKAVPYSRGGGSGRTEPQCLQSRRYDSGFPGGDPSGAGPGYCGSGTGAHRGRCPASGFGGLSSGEPEGAGDYCGKTPFLGGSRGGKDP